MRNCWLKKILVVCCISLAIFMANNAWAIDFSAGEIQGFSGTTAGAVQKRLAVPVRAPTTPTGHIVAPAAKAPTAFAGAELIKFKLNEVVITGNTVYSTAVLHAIFESSLHKEISLLDLQNMVYSVTQKYRQDGYILSRAFLPAQRIQNGVVHVQVVEGFVNEVTVSGNGSRIKPLLLAYGDKIAKTRPLRLAVLERYLLLANDLPGVTVRAVLTPSTTTPGAAELNMVTDEQTFQAYIMHDNYGSRYLGPIQNTVGANVNSVFAPGDSNIMRSVITSQTNELHFLQLMHTQPLGASGVLWTISGSRTRTNPGFLLTPLNVHGKDDLYVTDFAFPVIRSRSKSLTLHAAADYENNSSTVLRAPLFNDHTRSLVLGGVFNFSDSWRGINTISLDGEKGFDIFGAHEGGLLRSRLNGRSNFSKLNLNLSRTQSISTRFSAYVAVQSQYAFTPLLSSEEFFFGGPVFGRGYDPAELSGDRGVEGTAELRMDTAPDFRLLKAIQFYAFYDAGALWTIPVTGPLIKVSGTSTGLGARFYFAKHFSADTYLAKPLTRPVASLVALGQNGNKVRGFFQLRAYF